MLPRAHLPPSHTHRVEDACKPDYARYTRRQNAPRTILWKFSWEQLLLLLKAIFYWFTSSSTWQTHTFNTISFLLLEYLSAVSPTPALFRWSIVREWCPLARIRMAREATAGKISTCQLSPRFRRPPLTTSPMVHPSTPNLTTNKTESCKKMAGRERCLLCWSGGNTRLTLVVISRAIQVYLTL